MASRRIGSGCRPGLLFTVLLSVVALGGPIACRQLPANLASTGRGPAPPRPPLPSRAQSAPDRPDNFPAPVTRGQSPGGSILPDLGGPPSLPRPRDSEPMVVEVRVVGAEQTPVAEVLRQIHTRKGRQFSSEVLQDDVRRLFATRKFVDVKARQLAAPDGMVVIFEVYERAVLKYVKYVGCEKIKKSRLEKESGIKAGDALDPFAVEEGRRRLEEFYQSKGFNKVRVTVAEGSKTSDVGAIYLIDEGPKQRIGWTQFIGNELATDAHLRTKILSKPGIFWIFKGELSQKQMDEDVERLTSYYRSLGYYRAQVSRLPVDPTKDWQMLTFVIHEGPRYSVHDVSFVGNAKFSSEELAAKTELGPGEPFNQAQMKTDLAAVRDKYGSVGYIFADVNVDVRLAEERPELDLVYSIKEGKPYRVGHVDVKILGDNPHTRISTVLNRLSLYPGDLIDVRELRASERRLKASGLFEYDPARGIAPQIVVHPPKLEDMETNVASQPERPQVRGQSPGGVPHMAYRPPDGAGFLPPGGRRAPPEEEPEVADVLVCGRWIGGPQPVGPPSLGGPRRSLPPTGSGGATIVRGQYSADAGLSMPPLPRPDPRSAAPPAGSYGNYAAPAQTVPVPDRATYAASASPTSPASPTYSTYPQAGGSAPYGQNAPTSQNAQLPGAPTGTPAAAAGPYGNQFNVDGGMVTPGGRPLPGPIPGDPPLADGSVLLGNPPSQEAPLFVPLNPEVYETQTGRLMFSVGVNSEAGLIGSMILDEQNFDWTRFPRSWEEIRNGTAWRGAGQRLRLEAVPGTEVQRYTALFQEPYLFDTAVGLGLSGSFYNRWYREWDEERLGGRVSLGYQFTHDLSGTLAFRGEKVQIYNPITPTPVELTEALGTNAIYGFRAQLAHDTRDNTFLATEGHYFEIGVEQVIGTFTYTRGDVDVRKYFMIHQHPDGTGRHVLSLNFRGNVTSDGTPIYEHYYAGGFSTIRGFDYRGVSPRDANGIPIGGDFMMLASAEYMFPLTADDNLRGVVFCDTGTVEPRIDQWSDKYRVAPGFGLRIVVPAMGPAPIALDFAFPVSFEQSDDQQVFSFFVGFLR